MATTLKARAGSQLVYVFENRDTEGELIPNTDKTARFQFKPLHAEGPTSSAFWDEGSPNEILVNTSPGTWTLTVPGALTHLFSPTTAWELELVDPDGNVQTLDSGVIKTEPEVIS